MCCVVSETTATPPIRPHVAEVNHRQADDSAAADGATRDAGGRQPPVAECHHVVAPILATRASATRHMRPRQRRPLRTRASTNASAARQ
jgi:hypothetical protein